MDLDTAEGYWMAITQIEAQEILIQLRVAQYPWLTNEGRRTTHRQFHKMAYPATHSVGKLTTEEAAERLRTVING